MNYLIQEMWVCLIVAAILGAIIGWIFKHLGANYQLGEQESIWRSKLEQAESERDHLKRLADSSNAAIGSTPSYSASMKPTDPTSYSVEEIEGIGKSYGRKLAEKGITTTEQLLAKCGDLEGRMKIAEHVGIEDFVVRKWASMSDLMRIAGIAGQYAELMVYAGIDSVQHLGREKAEELEAKLIQSNEEQNRVKSLPDSTTLGFMIEQARTMATKMHDL